MGPQILISLVLSLLLIDGKHAHGDINYGQRGFIDVKQLKDTAITSFNTLKNRVTDIVNLGDDMDKKSLLGEDKEGIGAKITQLKAKANEELKSVDFKNTTTQKKIAENWEKVNKGIGAVATGISSMKQAYKSGNWLDFAIAGLDMASSLASLAGPIGAIVGQVLAMFSLILGLFKDAPVEESQEDMIRRVIKSELQEFGDTDLLARGNGYTRTFNILSKSIKHFSDEYGEISNDIASELFNKAFEGPGFLGELESHMERRCTLNMVKAKEYYDNRNSNKEWMSLRQKLVDNAAKCLKLVNLYTQLAIARQMMLVSLATLIHKSKCTICESLQTNILFIIKAEQEADTKILANFADPVRDYRKRFAVNYLYAKKESYPVVMAYLKKLDDSVGGDMYGDGVLVCKEKELLGDCLKLSFTDKKNIVEDGKILLQFHGFKEYKSFFVPRKYRIYNTGADKTIYGPEAMTINNYYGAWKKVYMARETEASTPFVVMCSAPSLETYHTCWHVPLGTKSISSKNDHVSMSIPAGVAVVVNPGKKMCGPYIGPQTIDDVCDGTGKLSVTVSETSQRSTDMIKICGDSSFGDCQFAHKSTELTEYKSCTSWSGRKLMRFKSIEVPTAVRVLLYSGKGGTGQLLGNYTGPIKVKDVDSATSINYMKVVSLVDDGDTDRVPYLCSSSEPETLSKDQACVDLKKYGTPSRRFAQRSTAI